MALPLQDVPMRQAVLVDSNGVPLDTSGNPPSFKLAGRNATDVYVFNALAITDTGIHNSARIDCTPYPGKKVLYVENTLNQAVNLTLFAYPSLGGGNAYSAQNVAASTNVIIEPGVIAALDDPINNFILQAACTVAPTSGSLTVFLEGAQQ